MKICTDKILPPFYLDKIHRDTIETYHAMIMIITYLIFNTLDIRNQIHIIMLTPKYRI